MCKQNMLLDYHFSQKSVIQENAVELRKQGFVMSYKDVYPDIYQRIAHLDGVAYMRGNVPLKLMVLIYDVVIVYIPPVSKKSLEMRFQLDFSELLYLCEQNIVIPIIGDATKYTAKFFEPLFNLTSPPYSLWARGLGLLDVFGMSNRLAVAREALPLDSIVENKEILSNFQKKSKLTERDAKRQLTDHISVMFADMCIFGCESDALKLNSLPEKDILNRLEIMNEIRTYPILFGMESQPNYNITKLKNFSSIPIKSEKFAPMPIPEENLKILFGGIGIDVSGLSTQEIIKYHSDGLGKQLRKALSSFNDYCNKDLNGKLNPDIFTVYEKAEIFQRMLDWAIHELTPQTYNSIDKTEENLTHLFQIGSVSLGVAVPMVMNTTDPQVFGYSLGCALGSIALSLPQELAEFITKLEVSGMQSKFVANMWKARKIVNK